MDRDSTSLYDRDFYAWTQEQATILRDAPAAGTNLPVDWENIAEEIEDMGRSHYNGAFSHVFRVIEHLLKLEHSPVSNPRRGWMESVANHRADARVILRDSPSLPRKLRDDLAEAYRTARKLAARGLSADAGNPERDLPDDCPYTLEQILDDDWWPASRHGLE